MGLAEQAILDFKQFTGDSSTGFGVSLILMAPNGTTITCNGYSTNHHLGIDAVGQLVNTKKASVCIAEGNMTGYPVRNSEGEVDLKGHKVTMNISTGTAIKYKVMDGNWFQDQKLGGIVMILEEYQA